MSEWVMCMWSPVNTVLAFTFITKETPKTLIRTVDPKVTPWTCRRMQAREINDWMAWCALNKIGLEQKEGFSTLISIVIGCLSSFWGSLLESEGRILMTSRSCFLFWSTALVTYLSLINSRCASIKRIHVWSHTATEVSKPPADGPFHRSELIDRMSL